MKMSTEMKKSANPIFLPTEIIIKIIENLNNTKDIRNCMRLSKEIHFAIFGNAKIMRKLTLRIYSYDWYEKLPFIVNKGKYFRNVKFALSTLCEKYTRFVLHHIPNVEDLEHCEFDYDTILGEYEIQVKDIPEPADMKNLKKLLIVHERFEKLTKIMKNVKNLEDLKCTVTKAESLDYFTDFVAQQNNLKELKVEIYGHNEKFPYRDISTEIKFHLKVLRINKCYNNNFHFLTFFQTQADSLEELALCQDPNEQIFELIFKMCKNLKNFSLESSNSVIYSEFYPDYKLESVKYLKGSYFTTSSLTAACRRFSNLESIKCKRFENISGIFDNIQTLELDELRVDNFQNIQLPNLKKLIIEYFSNISNENNFLKFMQNIRNIEHLETKFIMIEIEDFSTFKYIKNFKKIKFFNAGFYDEKSMRETYTELDTGEIFEIEKYPRTTEIFVDFERKTVRKLCRGCDGDDDDEVMERLINDEILVHFDDFEFLDTYF